MEPFSHQDKLKANMLQANSAKVDKPQLRKQQHRHAGTPSAAARVDKVAIHNGKDKDKDNIELSPAVIRPNSNFAFDAPLTYQGNDKGKTVSQKRLGSGRQGAYQRTKRILHRPEGSDSSSILTESDYGSKIVIPVSSPTQLVADHPLKPFSVLLSRHGAVLLDISLDFVWDSVKVEQHPRDEHYRAGTKVKACTVHEHLRSVLMKGETYRKKLQQKQWEEEIQEREKTSVEHPRVPGKRIKIQPRKRVQEPVIDRRPPVDEPRRCRSAGIDRVPNMFASWVNDRS